MFGNLKAGLRPRRNRRLFGTLGSVLARFKLPFRRYLMISTGMGVSALALALGISFASFTYADATEPQRRPQPLTSSYFIEYSTVLSETASVIFESTTTLQAQLAAEPALEVAAAPELAPEPAAPPPAAPAPEPEPARAEPAPPQAPRDVITVLRRIHNVNLTFYDCKNQGFCGKMANGRKVYEGAAACSYNLDFGTKFRIVGDPTDRIYVCEDRGLLDDTWVDIFWHDPADGWKWQAAVGRRGTIEIVGLPD